MKNWKKNNNIMRFTVYISIIMIFLAGCNHGRQADKTPETDTVGNDATPSIFFPEIEHDFGKVVEGEKVATVFKFENRGPGDIVIQSVTTTCGCTVPRFDKEPVKEGETGTVEVVFDTSYREGEQTKTIEVSSNADKPVVLLLIRAEVITN